MTKHHKKILNRGFRRLVVSVGTLFYLGLAVFCSITTAKLPGYLAVLAFIGGVTSLFTSFIFLVAQGLDNDPWEEIRGERK